MNLLKKLSNLFHEALKEHHHPLNPAPEVMKELREQGYDFELNTIAAFRGPIIQIWTVIMPDGQTITGRSSENNPQAEERYRNDYARALKAHESETPALETTLEPK